MSLIHKLNIILNCTKLVNFKMEGRAREEQRGEGRVGGSERGRELGRDERRLTATCSLPWGKFLLTITRCPELLNIAGPETSITQTHK